MLIEGSCSVEDVKRFFNEQKTIRRRRKWVEWQSRRFHFLHLAVCKEKQ